LIMILRWEYALSMDCYVITSLNPFVPRHRINSFGLILWLDFHVLFVCRKFFVHRIDPKGSILWIEIKSARLCAPRNLFHRIRASPSVTLPPKVTY
jgi:hypothetical protein